MAEADDVGEVALPDVIRVEPAIAARQLRRVVSSIGEHPAIAKWGHELLVCLLAQMLVDDFGPDTKKLFRKFGIEIPDA